MKVLGFVKKTILLLIAVQALSSCSKDREEPLVLWTNNIEFVSYGELFNATHDDKVIVLYKSQLAEALPPEENEAVPDILAGSWLLSGMGQKKFLNLSGLLSRNSLDPEIFYENLLQNGKIGEKQYLLPVSFNLPALVFDNSNYEYITESHTISFDQIKETALHYNRQNQDGTFSAMGFGPQWYGDFLYLILKSMGVSFDISDENISFNSTEFVLAKNYVQSWSEQINGGTNAELDFLFKYLYTPYYKQATSGHCLYSYTTSSSLFALKEIQLDNIDFRWVMNDSKIQVMEDEVMMGIYAKSRNKGRAKAFIRWFMSEQAQKEMMDRKFQMNLDTKKFGIAGGFSSVKSVTERLFPVYYRALLSNVPSGENLYPPQKLHSDWANIRQSVVIPFIQENFTNESEIKPLEVRFVEYCRSKQ